MLDYFLYSLVTSLAIYFTWSMFFSKKWNPKGLHCYVTGGSEGLGLETAIELANKGASISIVARTQGKLDKTLIRLEAARVHPDQQFNAYSFALDTAKESAKALQAVCSPYDGKAPDAIFMCAGASRPQFFLEMSEEEFSQGMTNGFWLQAWTAFAAAKLIAKQRKRGSRLVFVSSVLGYMTFVGYSSYSPAKHALRGLADTLQSELMLYDIKVQVFMAPTMYSPGFKEEQKTKPEITKKIEEPDADDGLTPEQAAKAMLKGVIDGHQHISANFITHLFRASTRGAVQRHNWALDAIYDLIGYIAMPIWRWSVDRKVLAHRKEHEAHLEQRGFFN